MGLQALSEVSLKSRRCPEQEVGQSKDAHAPGQGSRPCSPEHREPWPKCEPWLDSWFCAPEKGSETCVAAVGPVSGSHVPGRWVRRDSAVERGPRGGQGCRPHQGGPSEAHRFECSVTREWHYWEGSGLGVAGPVGGSVSLKVEGLRLQIPRPGPGSLSACGSGMYSSELPATRQDPVSRYTVDKTGRVSSKCLSVNLGLCTPPALSHI